MLTKNLCKILFLLFSILSFTACEKIENEITTDKNNLSQNEESENNFSNKCFPRPLDLIVTTTLDVVDFNGDINDLPGPDGLVSLREAAIAANNTIGPQVIGFNIPKSDIGFNGSVFTINLNNGFNQISFDDDSTTVDGISQTLFTGNTNLEGPEVVIDGSNLTEWNSGFAMSSNYNSILGLAVINMPWAGIVIGGDYNIVSQCYIGIDETGEIAKGNLIYGIRISGKNNLLKGNLISGNKYMTIHIDSDGNRIENNLIGTNKTGTKDVGNADWAISIFGGSGNVIGGIFPGSRNIISGNGSDAVFMYQANNNFILGNFIGTDITGNNPIPNNIFGGGAGVCVANSSHGNIIAKNRIAYNRRGVLISSSDEEYASDNMISKNAIFANTGFGIDLGSDNIITPNDPNDLDAGDNNLMNYPILNSARITPGKLHVQGVIDTQNPQNAIIEFFANPVPIPGGDPSGYGEGAIYLGSAKPNPHGKITANLPYVKPGTLITATATDADGNTSEFSAYIEAK